MRSVSSPRAVSISTGMSDLARSVAAQRQAVVAGQHEVEHDRSKAPSASARHIARPSPTAVARRPFFSR
jgi:hypothetical protein